MTDDARENRSLISATDSTLLAFGIASLLSVREPPPHFPPGERAALTVAPRHMLQNLESLPGDATWPPPKENRRRPRTVARRASGTKGAGPVAHGHPPRLAGRLTASP